MTTAGGGDGTATTTGGAGGGAAAASWRDAGQVCIGRVLPEAGRVSCGPIEAVLAVVGLEVDELDVAGLEVVVVVVVDATVGGVITGGGLGAGALVTVAGGGAGVGAGAGVKTGSLTAGVAGREARRRSGTGGTFSAMTV